MLMPCVSPQGLEEVGRSDIGKKIKEGMEQSAETVSKGGEKLGKTGAFRAISQVCIMLLSLHITEMLITL